MTRRHAAALLAGAAALSLAACGGGSAGGGGDEPPQPAAATPRAESGAQVFEVEGTSELTFAPDRLQASAGQVRIELRTVDGPPHNLVFANLPGAGFEELVRRGESKATTFRAMPGSYEFVCTIHPTMKGRLEVR